MLKEPQAHKDLKDQMEMMVLTEKPDQEEPTETEESTESKDQMVKLE